MNTQSPAEASYASPFTFPIRGGSGAAETTRDASDHNILGLQAKCQGWWI